MEYHFDKNPVGNIKSVLVRCRLIVNSLLDLLSNQPPMQQHPLAKDQFPKLF
jgi:hypothetical protein